MSYESRRFDSVFGFAIRFLRLSAPTKHPPSSLSKRTTTRQARIRRSYAPAFGATGVKQNGIKQVCSTANAVAKAGRESKRVLPRAQTARGFQSHRRIRVAGPLLIPRG